MIVELQTGVASFDLVASCCKCFWFAMGIEPFAAWFLDLVDCFVVSFFE